MNTTPRAKETKRAEVPPVGVFRSAEAFLIAADRHHQWLKENETVYALFDAMPIYFLYGQALELMLKSYLRAQGFSSKQLQKEYGHDVLKLYNKCRDHLLIMDQHSSGMTGIVTHHFSAANWHIRFRYVSDFNEPFPAFESVSVFSRVLLEAIRPVVCEGLEPLEAALLALQHPETLEQGATFSF